MKYIVELTISNPAHEHVSLRRNTSLKQFAVEAKDSGEAINRAAHKFASLGYKVHSATVQGNMNINEAIKWVGGTQRTDSYGNKIGGGHDEGADEDEAKHEYDLHHVWINGQVYKKHGEPMPFTGYKYAQKYAAGIVRNNPRLLGKVEVRPSSAIKTNENTENPDRPYLCVHVKKGKTNVNAKSSYEAVSKAAQNWKLKSTAGIDAYLTDVKHVATESYDSKAAIAKKKEQGLVEGSEEDGYSHKFVQSQIDYYRKHILSGNAGDRLRIDGSLNYYERIKNKRVKDGTWSLAQDAMKGKEFNVTRESIDYKKLEKPTIARIKSGETKPVDRTDYSVPPSGRRKNKPVGSTVIIDGRKYIKTDNSHDENIQETLNASDPASKWINDFVNSDSDNFKGVSKKERIRRALGAYYAAQKDKK